jgi:hypothetical protein
MITRLVGHPRCFFFQGDSAELLGRMNAGDIAAPCRIDLLLTDPPYGIKWKSQVHGTILNDESMDVGYAVVGFAALALREQRFAYVFGSTKQPFDLDRIVGLKAEYPLIWDKGSIGMGNVKLPYGPGTETVSVGSTAGGYRDKLVKRRQNVLRYPRVSPSKTFHPTEKPIGMLEELIRSATLEGEVVCDPFAGSGSTGVAALRTGRVFIGCELDPEHARKAAERLIREIECGPIFAYAREAFDRTSGAALGLLEDE